MNKKNQKAIGLILLIIGAYILVAGSINILRTLESAPDFIAQNLGGKGESYYNDIYFTAIPLMIIISLIYIAPGLYVLVTKKDLQRRYLYGTFITGVGIILISLILKFTSQSSETSPLMFIYFIPLIIAYIIFFFKLLVSKKQQ